MGDWSKPGEPLPATSGEFTLLILNGNDSVTAYYGHPIFGTRKSEWRDDDDDKPELVPHMGPYSWMLIPAKPGAAATPEPKVIQITAAAGGSSDEIVENLYALRDDGGIWEHVEVPIPGSRFSKMGWVRVESIEAGK